MKGPHAIALPPFLRSLLRPVTECVSSFFPKPSKRRARLENREFAFMRKLDGVRSKVILNDHLYGLALMLAYLVPAFAIRCFVDWWVEMPWGVRAAFLAAEVIVFGVLVARYFYWPRVHPPSDEACALLVEKHHKGLRSRLISALQLGQPDGVQPGMSRAMVAAMTRQVEAETEEMKFGPAVSTAKTAHLFPRGLVLTVLLAILLNLTGETGAALVRRAFLSTEPVPRKTRVEAVSGDLVVGIGDPVSLEFRTSGIIPGEGRLEVDYANAGNQRYRLDPSEDDARTFIREIDSVMESFAYTAYLGDGRSREHKVTVKSRPLLLDTTVVYEAPPYTRLPPTRMPTSDLTFLPGSKVTVTASGNTNLDGGQIYLAGVEKYAAMDRGEERSDAVGTFTVPSEGMTGLGVTVRGEDGVESVMSTVYPVTIAPDKAPTVKILFPFAIQQIVTRNVRLLLAFDARDDYGVTKVNINFVVNSEQTGSFELEIGATRTRLLRRFEWTLDDLGIPIGEGDILEYWVEVEDNNVITGPRTGESRRFVAKVVSQDEKIAELTGRLTDSVEAITAISDDQKMLSEDLQGIIEVKQTRE